MNVTAAIVIGLIVIAVLGTFGYCVGYALKHGRWPWIDVEARVKASPEYIPPKW